jgi:hypothetical protein
VALPWRGSLWPGGSLEDIGGQGGGIALVGQNSQKDRWRK